MRRLLVPVVVGLAVLALAGVLAARCASRPAASAREPGAQPLEARVVAASGPVERREDGGAWRTAAVGDALRATETIRTGAGGEAELAVDDLSRLTVAASSELRVRELSEVAHRFRLARGRVHVDYREDGERVLRVESEDGGAFATARAARASALQTVDAFSVATEVGEVRLSSSGRTVEVPERMRAYAWRGRPPSDPAPVRPALLVRVAERFASHDGECEPFVARADPAAEVTAGGERLPIAPDGRFTLRVASAAPVPLAVRDATGRTHARVLRCRPARATNVDLRWLDGPGG